METPLRDISEYERKNAVIGYCFLGIFVLLSRQARFQTDFINSHARVATVIQFLFLVLIVMTIRTGNFGSMLVFDFSLSNMSYFVGFTLLLVGLGMGMVRALQGKMPYFSIKSLSLKEIQDRIGSTGVDEVQKIPMILSHIPLIGNIIAAKYGPSFYTGERFATWAFLIGLLLVWIDQSMTLLIVFWSLTTVWIVYQSISLAIDNRIALLGDHLPPARTVHIMILTCVRYMMQLVSHTDGSLPHWSQIRSVVERQYHEDTQEHMPVTVAIPLVNIGYLFKNIHTVPVRSEVLQWCMITLLCITSIILRSPSLALFTLFISYTGFLSLKYQKYLAIPIIKEISTFIMSCIAWTQKKSKKETSSFTL